MLVQAPPCWPNYYSKLDQLTLFLYILYKHDQYEIHHLSSLIVLIFGLILPLLPSLGPGLHVKSDCI